MNFVKARWLLPVVSLVMVIGLSIGLTRLWAWLATERMPNSSDSTATHLAYAQLYEAAWRQDAGQGNETMTATLLSPRLQELLQADTQRSATDDQIARLMAGVEPDRVPIILTLDAVTSSASARLTDEELQQSLSLKAPDVTLEFIEARPIIVPVATITNSPVPTTHRVWLAGWHAVGGLDWDTVRDLQLTITNIGQTKTRTFTWARPGALVDQAVSD